MIVTVTASFGHFRPFRPFPASFIHLSANISQFQQRRPLKLIFGQYLGQFFGKQLQKRPNYDLD
jgi:hypothetical protein